MSSKVQEKTVGAGRYLTVIARILLGLLFAMTGLNGFLNFLPQPKSLPEGVVAFMTALVNTHYMIPLIMGTQLLAGLLLLAGRFVPLALALLAPVLVNIICFHLFLDPKGIGPGSFGLLLELYLAWGYREAFTPMLAGNVSPR